MDKQVKILKAMVRIELLEGRGKENGRIVKKLKRQLRQYQA